MKKAQEEQQQQQQQDSVPVSVGAPATEVVMSQERERQEKFRLELLKQKSRHDQSAVASPEVKRHLAEFVLQKKRNKDSAAASMGNLKLVPTAVPPSQPILRKTASESNLLKMKSPRLRAAPYSRGGAQMHPSQPAIPEATAINTTSSPAESVKSTNSSPPVELCSPLELAGLRQAGIAGASPPRGITLLIQSATNI